MVRALTPDADSTREMLADVLHELEAVAKTDAELDRVLALAIGRAASNADKRPPAPSQLTAAIVEHLRAKIRLTFNREGGDNCTPQTAGYFQFANFGQLTGWFPDLLGASHAPKSCIRVQMEGPACYWTNNGREFEKVT